MLSDRLAKLVRHGVMTKERLDEPGQRYAYKLTRKDHGAAPLGRQVGLRRGQRAGKVPRAQHRARSRGPGRGRGGQRDRCHRSRAGARAGLAEEGAVTGRLTLGKRAAELEEKKGGLLLDIAIDLQDDVALIAMDDGKKNSITQQALADLNVAFDKAETEAKAVVLAGRPGSFCAGFDLATMTGGDVKATMALGQGGGKLALRLWSFPKPLIAACTGHAFTIGAIWMCACDTRIGEQGPFKIGMTETKLGMTLGPWALEPLKARLSRRLWVPSIVQARVYDPDGALEAGFLDEVVRSGSGYGDLFDRQEDPHELNNQPVAPPARTACRARGATAVRGDPAAEHVPQEAGDGVRMSEPWRFMGLDRSHFSGKLRPALRYGDRAGLLRDHASHGCRLRARAHHAGRRDAAGHDRHHRCRGGEDSRSAAASLGDRWGGLPSLRGLRGRVLPDREHAHSLGLSGERIGGATGLRVVHRVGRHGQHDGGPAALRAAHAGRHASDPSRDRCSPGCDALRAVQPLLGTPLRPGRADVAGRLRVDGPLVCASLPGPLHPQEASELRGAKVESGVRTYVAWKLMRLRDAFRALSEPELRVCRGLLAASGLERLVSNECKTRLEKRDFKLVCA